MRYTRLKLALFVALLTPLSMSRPSVTTAGPFGASGAGGGFGGAGRAGGAGRVGGAGGISNPSVRGGRFGQGSSVIGDGMSGFKMYSPSGTSRYIGSTPSTGKVYHPDGSSSTVIPDGKGNLNIYGPQGTHKAYGNPTNEADTK